MAFFLYSRIPLQRLGISPFYTLAARILRGLSLLALAASVSGCALWQNTTSEPLTEARAVVPDSWPTGASTPVNASELASWWAQFGDPTLTGLIEQALASNNNLAAAEGRLRAARAAYAAAQGARYPAVNASGSASRQKSIEGPSFKTDLYNLGLDASWELDLFGKLSGSAAAAAAGAQSSEASLYDVQRTITADVALNYINLRDAQARLQIARDNLDIQQENLNIARWRNQAGLGTQLDVQQASTAAEQTRAAIPPLENAVTTAINQIDVLMGQSPGSSSGLLSTYGPLPEPPPITGIGLPAQLLERRPDILAAQYNLEAEVIRIGVAKADLYPSLRLSGTLDTTSSSASRLFDTSFGSVLGGITAPIFQGGQIQARIEQQKGNADVALANYRGTILAALQDVDNALASARSSREREAALKAAEQSALLSLQIAEVRYRGGSIDFQTLLDVQRSLLVVQESRAGASAARTTASVQLFKALGGGWDAAPTP